MTQPVVGAIADESRSRWGRRRPFIFAGAIISALCLLILGFTREIVDTVIHDEGRAANVTVFLAVFAIYLVDFAVNAGSSLGVLSHEIQEQSEANLLFTSQSYVCRSKSHCRHITHHKTADRICLE